MTDKDTLPDCMMPDGADPCIAYQVAIRRIEELENNEAKFKDYVDKEHTVILYFKDPEVKKAWVELYTALGVEGLDVHDQFDKLHTKLDGNPIVAKPPPETPPTPITIQSVLAAYEAGFYEGVGDDRWYKDHSNTASDLDVDAIVHRPMNEYMKAVHKYE